MTFYMYPRFLVKRTMNITYNFYFRSTTKIFDAGIVVLISMYCFKFLNTIFQAFFIISAFWATTT